MMWINCFCQSKHHPTRELTMIEQKTVQCCTVWKKLLMSGTEMTWTGSCKMVIPFYNRLRYNICYLWNATAIRHILSTYIRMLQWDCKSHCHCLPFRRDIKRKKPHLSHCRNGALICHYFMLTYWKCVVAPQTKALPIRYSDILRR